MHLLDFSPLGRPAQLSSECLNEFLACSGTLASLDAANVLSGSGCGCDTNADWRGTGI